MEPVGEQIPLSCVRPHSVSPRLAVPQSTVVESAVVTLSGRTMGIDDSGKCSWHAQRQFGLGFGVVFLGCCNPVFHHSCSPRAHWLSEDPVGMAPQRRTGAVVHHCATPE